MNVVVSMMNVVVSMMNVVVSRMNVVVSMMNVVVSMMNVDGPAGGRVLMVTCRWRCDGSCCMVTQPAAGDVMVHVVWSPCLLLEMRWLMLDLQASTL